MENPVPTVRVILQNDKGEILFIKRKDTNYEQDKWCLPGGDIESGETVEQACKKEVKEETNLDISNIKFLFYNDDLPIENISERHCLGLYFTADFTGEIKLNHESSDHIWLNPNELEDKEIAFDQKEIIKKFLC